MTETRTTPPRRRVPKQSRSKLTVEKIKQASLDLLLEEGLEGLNTNAIADRAGVNIATLYGYFPDKYSILYDLFDAFEARRSDYVLDQVGQLEGDEDWREWFNRIVDRLAEFRLQDPAGILLRRALVVTPELQELDVVSTTRSAEGVASALSARSNKLDGDEWLLVATVTVETITHLLDSAFAVSPPQTAKVEQLKNLISGYLSPYLD